MPPGVRPPLSAMQTEWMKCPRCKNRKLLPELIGTDRNGTKMWWVCENYESCMFPLDMPAEIFTVIQTPYQQEDGYVPLPKILSLPEKYHHMYPITFACSLRSSRESSVVSTKANSKNETISTSESGSLSEKSSGQNRLKADVVAVQSDVTAGSAIASTSEPSEAVGENDNIDQELEDASKKPSVSCRTLPRKRFHDTTKSWAALIEKVASDQYTSDTIINMGEAELFIRMKEFFDGKYLKGTASMCFKRPPPKVTYRVDDVELCLRAVTHEDWEKARRRLPNMSLNARAALRTANADVLLKTVGIDLQQRRKAIGEKVEKVMREFSGVNVAKRQKFEEKRAEEKQQKTETLKNDIHLSVSARLLNRKRIRDDEGSRASTPSTICFSEPATPRPSSSYQEPSEEQFVSRPVQFHIGNEDDQQEGESTWGFDLNGVYESIHSRNRVDEEPNLLDPVEALLFPVDDNPVQDIPQLEDHGVESGDEQQEDEDDDPFAGFDNFSSLGNSNTDFVNDNFGF